MIQKYTLDILGAKLIPETMASASFIAAFESTYTTSSIC